MSKKILCVYATRQIDSNLFMASTIFSGLKDAGYEVYMAFAGTKIVNTEFRRIYSKYFNDVCFYEIPESSFKKLCSKQTATKLAYSYYRHFIMDGIFSLPIDNFANHFKDHKFDNLLSFIPPILSGRLAINLRDALNLKDIPLIQFWTDPLSLGRCNSINEIPKTRFLHVYHERSLLKHADRVVFWFPLLCEMEKKLHPLYADKMSWSYVSYVPHKRISNKKCSNAITIGLFGAYPSNVRNIKPLLEAIAELKDIDFIIRGDGDLPYDVSHLRNLDIKSGRLPLNEIELLENNCDILLSLSSKNGIAPGGKTFYYASYHKPIIHIADGINGEYYNNYLNELEGRYLCCKNVKDEIISTIKIAIDIQPDFILHLPERMNAAVIAKKILGDK